MSTPKSPASAARRIAFEVAPCSLGFVVRPAERLDNRRWYFERRQHAQDHADYLNRQQPGQA